MKCLSFNDILKTIQGYQHKKEEDLTSQEKRGWKELQEFIWCRSFVDYLKTTFGFQYEEICKYYGLEDKGVDIILHSKITSEPDIHIQLTHANEYDMRPIAKVSIKDVDISGNCIVGAVVHKCSDYCERKIDTKNIILLIQGIDESTKIDDLVKNFSFLKIFENLPCFKGVYYTTHKSVYPLKKMVL